MTDAEYQEIEQADALATLTTIMRQLEEVEDAE